MSVLGICVVHFSDCQWLRCYFGFSPIDVHFVSASMDHTARLWTCDLAYPLRVFAGHTSSVNVRAGSERIQLECSVCVSGCAVSSKWAVCGYWIQRQDMSTVGHSNWPMCETDARVQGKIEEMSTLLVPHMHNSSLFNFSSRFDVHLFHYFLSLFSLPPPSYRSHFSLLDSSPFPSPFFS